MNRTRSTTEPARRGFTLVELLVTIMIVLTLMALLGAAVSAARTSQRKQATQAMIARLDLIVRTQYETYAVRGVPDSVLTGANKAAARGSYLRRLASAEMPDNWRDVETIASGTSGVPTTAAQRAYVGIYQSLKAANSSYPTGDYADAECLFMIVMQGGLVDCVDCGELKASDKGDLDGDGAFEFLDSWGRPIRYVLWPAGLELPPGSGRYFTATAPFVTGTSPAATMRPLIFSGGPDQVNSLLVNGAGSLQLGSACGDPANADVAQFGARDTSGLDARADNVTNFDTEAAK